MLVRWDSFLALIIHTIGNIRNFDIYVCVTCRNLPKLLYHVLPRYIPIVAVGRSIWQEGVAQLSPISQLSYRDNVGAAPELVNQEREEKWQI